MRIDLHTHSNVSDGTDSPTRLVLAAKQVGLDMVALTDHDTMAGVAEAAEVGRRIGVQVLPGVELSTNLDGVEVHLLGYGPDPREPEFAAEMVKLRQSRAQRIPEMLKRLAALGVGIDSDAVLARAAATNSSVGRPHLADELVAAGHVANRDEAFARYLDSSGPAYVPRYTVDLIRGIELLHGAGGAVVLAHPGIRGASRVLTGEVIEMLAEQHELDGIEVDYPLHDATTRDLYHRIGARSNLVRTGSSDYHGMGKINHDLGSVTTRPTAYGELLRRIERHTARRQ